MSVTLDCGPDGLTWPTGDDVLVVTGLGPRRATVFVNDAVAETDGDGRFTVELRPEPDDQWLVAGILTGCACVSQRVPLRQI
ncbi:MAG: hypothetical protein HZB16_02315 [Armatimonadetes bacterium]|nr:hypothetical protein [Armatimonadota bacterium]